ncbi:MAG: galactokinase [Brevinema sp.]
MMEIKGLRNRFREIYNSEATDSFFAPGRINLIGEHTDYNGGHVFPAALTMGINLLLSSRNDKKICFYSANFDHVNIVEADLTTITSATKLGWAGYLVGALIALKEKGFVVDHGFNSLFYGDIPNGAGLSSSAALGVVFVTAMNNLHKFGLSPQDCALIAQRAEHLAGTQCGIMDQFASAMGKKDHAIFLDCNTLEYQYVPVILNGYTLMIMDSCKKHALNDGKYNERRGECDEAVRLISTKKPIKTLGELSEEEFAQFTSLLPEPILRRARHAVTENQRTLKSLNALKEGRLLEFGEYLNQSHASLRDDYEVTGLELDTLTDLARAFPGVIGTRMTGAGFGGSCIALIPKGSETQFSQTVGEEYHKTTGIKAQFYVSQIGDGARRL